MNERKFRDKMLEDLDALPLFEVHRYPYVPAVKAPHRDTSVAAAEQVTIKHNSLKGRCLGLITQRGTLTADEAAEILNESVLNVRPAMSALVSLGRLVDSGERRLNASGNTMICWRLRTQNDVDAAFINPPDESRRG